jgi:hypothetical protein
VLWFAVWTVMVLGWVAGVIVGLRWLWRRAVGLGHELGQLAAAVERFSAALAAQDAPSPLAPVAVGTDGSEAAARVEELRRARRERKAARAKRHAERYAQWAVLAGRRTIRGGAAEHQSRRLAAPADSPLALLAAESSALPATAPGTSSHPPALSDTLLAGYAD